MSMALPATPPLQSKYAERQRRSTASASLRQSAAILPSRKTVTGEVHTSIHRHDKTAVPDEAPPDGSEVQGVAWDLQPSFHAFWRKALSSVLHSRSSCTKTTSSSGRASAAKNRRRAAAPVEFTVTSWSPRCRGWRRAHPCPDRAESARP